MNPVLKELLSQLQQKQITFDEFKLDLLGLCKMSPGLVTGARLLVEGAVGQKIIPAAAANQLIQQLESEAPPQNKATSGVPNKTLMRPGTAADGGDATMLMPGNQPAQSGETVVMNRTTSVTSANDATVLMKSPTQSDATALMPQTNQRADATQVLNAPVAAAAPEKTVALSPASVNDATRLMPTSQTPEKTQRIAPPQPATPQPTPVAPTAEKTQRIDISATAEKTQRIASPTMAPPATAEKTQQIDYSQSPDKTQRINQSPQGAPAPRQFQEMTSDSGLDFDLSATPDKTQRIAPDSPGTLQGGTKPADSLMGTMERFLTDGPLPHGVDMGVVPFGPGTVIKERFLLKEQIGSGGMGVVYSAIDRRKTEARDPNPLVALKILGSDFARHPKSLIALQREARKAQELAHPNVATVYDFDREGDVVYMTMELLNGRSLDGLTREVRGKGIKREEAWPIIRGIAEGLAYAHRKGLVHSDLKPANVFLLEENFPKLLDFGIARAIPSRLSKQTVKDIFDAGSLGAYTVPYATLEMVEGVDPHPADDIYALGLMAYELLAGVHPYKRQGAVDAKKMGMKPAPIKGLPRREWKVIERSVSFNRADRPQDADEFLKELRGITPLQKSLIAASAVLALTAGYFAYSSYQEAGPEIPFSQLSTTTQEQFQKSMSDGDQLWNIYVKDKNIYVLQEAVEQYAAAYDLHPRNRDAVKALKKVADAALDATKDNPDQQRELAKSLIGRSAFLEKDYPPTHKFAD